MQRQRTRQTARQVLRGAHTDSLRRIRKVAQATVELLESRTLLTASTWTGGTGNWNVASNWSGGVVPNYSYDVSIPAGANVTISDGESVNTLTTAAGSMVRVTSAGSFGESGGTINGALELDGTLNNLTSAATAFTFAGTTTITGTISTGYETNSGQMTFNGGSVSESFFTNTGTVTITNGLRGGGGIFTNTASGTINVTDDTGITFNSYFINQGTLSQTGGTGTDNFGGTGGEFEDLGGTINVNSGTFEVKGQDIFHTTQFNIAAGAAFTVDQGANSQAISIAGNLTGTGGGQINFNTGSIYAQDENGSATNATLNFPSGMANVVAAAFGVGGATVINAGFLTFMGTSAQYTSYQTGENIDNTGTINIANTSPLPLGRTVNESTGVIDFQTDGGLLEDNGNAINLTNKGTILKSGGSGTSVISCIYLNDGGALDVQTGTLSFQVGSTGYIAGPITVAPGAVVNFDGRAGIYLQGTLSAGGGGTVTLTNGSLDGPNANFSETSTAGAALNFPANTFYVEGGYLENDQQSNLVNMGAVYFEGSAANNSAEFGNMINAGSIYVPGVQVTVEPGSKIINQTGGLIDFTGAATIPASINNAIDNLGTIQINAGAGTLNLATPYAAVDGNGPMPGFTNDGTIEVVSGTLIYPSVSLVDANNNIAQGTYQVDAGATLNTDLPVSVTSSAGGIILNGANASFPDISALTTNTGTLAVVNGATFSTAGSLTNSGKLSVGGNLTVNGALTESGNAATLDFPVAAAAGSANAPLLTVTGATTLTGNLTAEYANGFAAASGSAYTVARFSQPATGSFASTAGAAGPAFTPVVSSSSIVLNGTGAGASDLAIGTVTAPATVTAGQPTNVSWTYTNAGTNPASGSWVDSVYLTSTGTLNASSVLLGQVTETGPLAPGASRSATASVMFPPFVGSMKFAVQLDSGLALSDTNRANNVGASAAITSTIPTLAYGGSVTGTISNGQSYIYQLTIPGGTDVSVSASYGTTQISDLEISEGSVPTPATAQYVAPFNITTTSTSTVLIAPQPGVYYVRLSGRSTINGAQAFTLSDAAVANGLRSVSPSAVGNGTASVTITGSGFGNVSAVNLLDGGGNIVATGSKVAVPNGDTVLATFNLASVAMGQYSLQVVSNQTPYTLPNAVTVQQATASAGISLQLIPPAITRPGIYEPAYIKYTNLSNVDVPAEWTVLYGSDLSFELAGGSSPNIQPQTSYTPDTLSLMTINQDGAAGVLPAGYSGEFIVNFKETVPDTAAHDQIPMALLAIGGSTTDLGSIAGAGPTGLSQTAATVLQAEINGQNTITNLDITPTVTVSDSALTQYIDNIATVLSSTGNYDPSFDDLFAYAENSADNFGSITQAYTIGLLGEGSGDPYNISLKYDGSGNLTITTPEGIEQFIVQPDRSYTPASPIDTSMLVQGSSGITLTTSDGTVYKFPAIDTSSNVVATVYVSSITTPAGLVVSYAYNVAGQLASITQPGNLTTTFQYSGSGLLTSTTDPAGNQTTFGYTTDAENAPVLTSITTSAGTTTLAYTPSPVVGTDRFYASSPAKADLISSITLPDGSGELFSYDDFGREIGTSLPDGSAPVTFSYDSTGLIQTTTYADGTNEATTRGIEGQVLRNTDPLGNSTSYVYTPDGLLTSILSPGGATVKEGYAAGLQTTGTSPSGATGSATYDARGDITSLTDGNGNVVGLTYNAGGLATHLIYPDGSGVSDAYNALGQLTQETQRGGVVISHTYDSLGDVTASSYSDGNNYTFTYDSKGDLLTATSAAGTETYTYNAAGYVTSDTDPSGHVQNFSYGPGGLLTSVSDSTGVVNQYAYDADARVSQVKDGAGNLIAGYSYDALGRISMVSFGNGTKTVYGYDAAGRVKTISNLNPSGVVTTSTAYTYNGQDLPLNATDQTGAVTTYTYDLAGQITSASLPGGRTITYTYDADGNRQSVTDSGSTTTYTSNNMDQYSAAGTTTFTYDANGNLATQTNGSGTTTYTYNDFNELAGSTGPAGHFTYTYDALGQLISFTDNGVLTTLQRDWNGDIVAAYDASGHLIDRYNYGLSLVGESGGSGGSNYFNADPLGNITGVTNSTGAIVNSYSYDPFGGKLTSTGPAGNLFTYSGGNGVLDLSDGLYQMQHRSYSPALGRFLQPDPLGESVSLNLYQYVGNSPTTEVDPTGLHEEKGGTSGGTPQGQHGEGGKEHGGDAAGAELGVPFFPSNEATFTLTGVASGSTSQNNSLVFTVGWAQGGMLGEGPKFSYSPHGEATPGWESSYAVYTPAGGVERNNHGETTYLWSPTSAGATQNVKYNIVFDGSTIGDWIRTSSGDNLDLDKSRVFTPQQLARLNKGKGAHRYHQRLLFQRLRNIPALMAMLKGLTPQQALAYLNSIGITQVDPEYIANLLPGDPNGIYGPVGFGSSNYIPASQTLLPYTIEFQNKPTASVPAQTVVVTEQLDPNLNWSTFQLTSFNFGSYTVNIPAGQTSYTTIVDATATVNADVKIVANLNPSTGLLMVTYTTLDPTTVQPINSVNGGFLPPDDSTGRGEGSISYTIQPKSASVSGATIQAQASIVFDSNAAIATPVWTNIIDAAPPTSAVAALPTTQTLTNFTVTWAGQDDSGGSGIAYYTIYASVDGGAFSPWIQQTSATSGSYPGSPGHTYAFYSTATDNAGNIQVAPSAAQASTTVPAIARTLTVTAGHPAKFTDAAGKPVTITLNGPGSATLSFLTASGAADPVSIVLTGTTSRSSFTASNVAGLTLSDIQINGSLANFTAASADLIGTLTITGTVRNMRLGSVATFATIDIQSGGATNFHFGTVHDLSLTTAGSISSLIATSWTNGALAADSITASSIRMLNIRGAFDASVTLSGAMGNFTAGSVTGGTWTIGAGAARIAAGSIAGLTATLTGAISTAAIRGDLSGSLTANSIGSLSARSISGSTITLAGSATDLRTLSVSGNVLNSQLRSTGNLGRLSVGGASGSVFFVGVSSAVSALPTAAFDFTAADSIVSFTARGTSPFADTQIGASSIGMAALRNVTIANGGTPFGLAARSLSTFSFTRPGGRPFAWNHRKSPSLLTGLPGDLKASLVS